MDRARAKTPAAKIQPLLFVIEGVGLLEGAMNTERYSGTPHTVLS
jgi:hypothetical protein